MKKSVQKIINKPQFDANQLISIYSVVYDYRDV
jgi:hypothetical protein